MKKEFGFFSWMPYENSKDDFEEYKKLKNKIPKEKVIAHMESLEPWATSLPGKDPFTGERLQSGVYDDGEFLFPMAFVHYFKNYEIGIPYEYEQYLEGLNNGI